MSSESVFPDRPSFLRALGRALLSLAGLAVFSVLLPAPLRAQGPAAAMVDSVSVAAGQVQRSLVKSISAHYSRPVSAPVRASDLVLYNITHGLVIPAETQAVVHDPATGTARFTFPSIHGGALPQGNYIARVLAPFDPATVLTCGSASPLPPDFVFSFHVRFGDMDGDRDVDFRDASFLWKTWDRSLPAAAYETALDFTFDGKVDAADGAIFTWNYFTVFPAAPALHAQLLNDTGISPRDGITSDPSVAGVLIKPSPVTRLQGRFLSGKTAFTDLTGAVDETGALLIPAAMMPAIYGGALPYTQNTLLLQALNAEGAVLSAAEVAFQHHAFNNCPPYFVSSAPAGAQTRLQEGSQPADLRRWSVIQYEVFNQENANWQINADGTQVTQTVNADASILLSDFDITNTTINGKWSVLTAEDDDFMGFVFGFQDDKHYYVFCWKQADQTIDGANSPAGMAVRLFNTDTTPELTDFFWTEGAGHSTTLFHDATKTPWQDFREYDFTLDFKPGDFTITVRDAVTGQIVGNNGQPIRIQDSTFTSGRFGFYNHSQGDIAYRSFERRNVPAQTYDYAARAVDPDGDPLTYSIVSGPSGLVMDAATGKLTWAPVLDQAGEHGVTIRARDNRGGEATQSFVINIVNFDAPPSLSLVATKYVVNPGEASQLNVRAQDDIRVDSVKLTVNGAETPTDAMGNAAVSSPAIGFIAATATAKDNAGQTTVSSLQIRVRDPGELTPPDTGESTPPGGGPGDPVIPGGPTGDPADVPVIRITSPAPETSVSYLTDITGSITSPTNTLHSWRVEFAPADQVDLYNIGAPGPAWKLLGSGTQPVTGGTLAVFDPTVLPNNPYVIRAVAFNTNGRGWAEPLPLNVAGNAKLGNFRLEFTDLQVPLAGIPITVSRIYDTLEAGIKGDFGYGWRLGLQDGDIRETSPGTGGLFTANPYKQGSRVYITTPDGKRVGFTFEAEPAVAGFFGTAYRATFRPDPGVYEKLEVPEGSQGFLTLTSSGHVGLYLFGFGWNPDDFILTTLDGIRYSYSQDAGLRKAEDLNGNTVTYSRDGALHSSGVSVVFIRDAQGRITEIRDPSGKPVKYSYDAAGDLKTVTDRTDLATTFDYLTTPAHYLDKITDPLGRQAVRTEYGPDGRIKAVIDALGNRTEQNFDPASFTGTRTDARGNITTLVYDPRGNLLEERKPEGGITRYEYSDPANPDKETAIIDPLGRRTVLAYDASGNKRSVTDPTGLVTSYTHNALNRITSLIRKSSTGAVLSTESAEYDNAGHLTRLVNAAGDHRDFLYDSRGRLIRAADFEGNITAYDYTNACACGSPGTITYADGTVKRMEYNGFGQITKFTDETGAITRSEYDAKGRKTRETDHDAKATVLEYDANDNLVRRTDRLGRITRMAYDAQNRLTREIKILTDDGNDTNDVILNYEYDGDGRLTALVDPSGNRTEFAFDRDGRQITRKDAAGASIRMAYDPSGNVSEIIDRNGRKRSFLYNAGNQLTAERWHDPGNAILRTITITYDELGRRTGITDPDSTYAWQFDPASRIREESNAGSPHLPPVIFTYAYNRDGRLNSVTDNTGVSVLTGFDVRGRSDRFIWSGGGISPASVDMDRNGRGQITRLNRYADAALASLVSQTTHDQIAPQGWVKQIQHRSASGALYSPGTNFLYTHDAEGQVTTQSSQGNTTAYTYDLAGQLTSASHTAAYPGEFYTYDKAGNRTSSHLHAAYTIGTANRLQSDGISTYTHDAEGNLTRRTETATGKVTDFTYDHRGRVTAVTERAAAAGAVTAEQRFIFDALDRRIGIIAGSGTTLTAYHGDNAWADYHPSGSAARRYLFADRMDGNIAAWTPSSGTYWQLTDKIGSIREIIQSNGSLLENKNYDSFGLERPHEIKDAANRFAFGGRETIDGELYYSRARLYSSSSGKFTSEDPLDYLSGDFNIYRYAYNSPAASNDPTGLSVATEYGSLTSRVSANKALQDCLKDLSIGIVTDMAVAGLYIFVAGNQVYGGRSIDPQRRFREHQRRLLKEGIEIIEDSFKVFKINPDSYRNHLGRVRQAEQGLINILRNLVEKGELMNRRNEIKGGFSPCG